jgi:hypothetical protein
VLTRQVLYHVSHTPSLKTAIFKRVVKIELIEKVLLSKHLKNVALKLYIGRNSKANSGNASVARVESERTVTGDKL